VVLLFGQAVVYDIAKHKQREPHANQPNQTSERGGATKESFAKIVASRKKIASRKSEVMQKEKRSSLPAASGNGRNGAGGRPPRLPSFALPQHLKKPSNTLAVLGTQMYWRRVLVIALASTPLSAAQETFTPDELVRAYIRRTLSAGHLWIYSAFL
jgi:hypothetical protein